MQSDIHQCSQCEASSQPSNKTSIIKHLRKVRVSENPPRPTFPLSWFWVLSLCKALLSHYPNEFKNSSMLCSYCWWWSNTTNLIESPCKSWGSRTSKLDSQIWMPLDDYSGIPISFWPNLNRIPKNLKFQGCFVLVVLGRTPNTNAMPPTQDDFTRLLLSKSRTWSWMPLEPPTSRPVHCWYDGPIGPMNQGTKVGRGWLSTQSWEFIFPGEGFPIRGGMSLSPIWGVDRPWHKWWPILFFLHEVTCFFLATASFFDCMPSSPWSFLCISL